MMMVITMIAFEIKAEPSISGASGEEIVGIFP